MAMITPTVDSVGDAALTNSIIDKSITEFQDELVTDIREHAFYNCTALKKVVFGSVSDVADRAFDGCTALTTVDFHTSTPFGDYVFNKCSALTALILRGATVCHAISGTLQNSGIASGNGYVYVPAALVDAYKAHSIWGQYDNQIRAIEEWPEVCDPYSWETVAIAIEKGTYKDMYKIGDCVPVDLGSEGIINMQIAAFDADTLADGSGTAAISWVAKELLKTTTKYNTQYTTYDGWEKSGLRTYLTNTIMPLIPQSVYEMIQSVTKTQRLADTSNNFVNQSTDDKVWVPGIFEMTVKPKTYQALFPTDPSRIKNIVGDTSATKWWCRDAYTGSSAYCVGASGTVDTGVSFTNVLGVCIGFCTGKTPT